MAFTFTFLKLLSLTLSLVTPILLFLSLIIIGLALLAAKKESWRPLDALYWAAITATTVGYGDMRPVKRISRLHSISIAMLGIMFTGVVVSATVSAATTAIELHVNTHPIEKCIDQAIHHE